MANWLIKTEPSDYSLDDLERDGRAVWDGVRNALAQRHLRAMRPGERLLVYHTGSDKAVVGAAQVHAAPRSDPKDKTGKLHAVEIAFSQRFARTVPLAEIKADPRFADFDLVRISRLSIMPVSAAHWSAILKLAGATSTRRASK